MMAQPKKSQGELSVHVSKRQVVGLKGSPKQANINNSSQNLGSRDDFERNLLMSKNTSNQNMMQH